MAQPNAAREPSMDEILASIRKIIESNEPGLPGFPANDLGPAPDEGYRGERSYEDDRAYDTDDIHLTIDDDALVAEFEAEVQQHAQPVPVREPQPEVERSAAAVSTPPLSLADVAARVRAASERHSLPLREPDNAVAQRPRIENPTVTARMTPAPVSQQPAVQAEDKMEPAAAPVTAALAQPAAAIVEKIEAPAAQSAPERVEAESHPVSIITEKEVNSIVSPAVGEQVARSFGDLALAFDSSQRRSFDEIAEDMLRPMLQEWLDDNLPTLVERLVREEIERVARGPRR
ncbi:PopZ family protein [Pararhizobium sp. O133]|uniref:PopZ family protein n=1 Tax=Pararhizobium sp. O133 TaxID=3449278 RepID=UPI003F688364